MMPQHTYTHVLNALRNTRSAGTQRRARTKDQQCFTPAIDSQARMILKAVQVQR